MDQRPSPAGAKHEATLLQIRPCALCGKRYCFRPCILKLGVLVAQRTGRMLKKRDFFRVKFYDVSFYD